MAVVGLPALPLDCIDRVSVCHVPAWQQYCGLAQVCSTLSGTLRSEGIWCREYHSRFHGATHSEQPTSPTRLSWQQRFMQRHQTEREFLHGSFGQWSRDNRAKCLAVRLAAEGSRAFAAFEDGQIAEYTVSEGELPQLTDIFAPPEQMRPATCVLPHRGAIFAGYGTGEVLGIQDKRPVFEAKMHGGVTSLCASGGLLVTGSHDCCVRLYDVERADSPCVIAGLHTSAVASVAALPESDSVVTGSQDRHLRVIDPRSGRVAAVARLGDWCLCVEPVDATTVRASDKSVKLFDLRNLAQPVSEEMRHRKLVCEFRSDRIRLVSCGLDGRVQVRSLEPETVAPRTTVSQLCEFTDYVMSVDFHERSLVCGTNVGALEIFQL